MDYESFITSYPPISTPFNRLLAKVISLNNHKGLLPIWGSLLTTIPNPHQYKYDQIYIIKDDCQSISIDELLTLYKVLVDYNDISFRKISIQLMNKTCMLN